MQQIFIENLLYPDAFLGAGISQQAKLTKIAALVGSQSGGETGNGAKRQHLKYDISDAIDLYAPVGLKYLGLQDPATSHKSLRSPKSFCLYGLYLFDIYYIKNLKRYT